MGCGQVKRRDGGDDLDEAAKAEAEEAVRAGGGYVVEPKRSGKAKGGASKRKARAKEKEKAGARDKGSAPPPGDGQGRPEHKSPTGELSAEDEAELARRAGARIPPAPRARPDLMPPEPGSKRRRPALLIGLLLVCDRGEGWPAARIIEGCNQLQDGGG